MAKYKYCEYLAIDQIWEYLVTVGFETDEDCKRMGRDGPVVK